MDCSNTSGKCNKSRAAMTLVEMMVATGVGSILMLVLGSLTLYSARSFSAMVNYTDLNKESRRALDSMSKEIRQSRGLLDRTPTSLTFAQNSGKLIYTYNAAKKTVIEETSGQTVLKNCTFWTNQIFQRAPQAGNFKFIETPSPSECKMVQISWICISDGAKATTNSESVQSMKVVIRKKPD